MYLEKLKIQGFKSFANKNSLVFPGMLDKDRCGITAVVGPNGSGKSNIADAVRWALGEQSMKTLRGKKSEDVIFSGSDKKGKLGMAEVSLFLNNQGQHRSKAIDYSEVILTRRLYRNGDSEYLLNNSRARLSDIQMMLARASFGQKTYSVIGQGMVEGFLNTSLAERKEFFDEATGVKQFQIKRDSSLNKLRASYENLSQVNILLSEIEPRLRSLTRQVNKLKKREELEKELKTMQLDYYSKIWQEINSKFKKASSQFLELESIQRDKQKKLGRLNRELDRLENQSKKNAEYESWRESLVRLRDTKDKIVRELVRLEAQAELKLEKKGMFDLSWLKNKKEEISKEIKNISERISDLEKNIQDNNNINSNLLAEQKKVDQKLSLLNEELSSLNSKRRGGKMSKAGSYLEDTIKKIEQLDAQNNLVKIKNLIKEVKFNIKKAIAELDDQEKKNKIEYAQEKIVALTQDKSELIIKINENNLRISARTERAKLLAEKVSDLKNELESINIKLDKYKNQSSKDESSQKIQELKKRLLETEDKISAIKIKIEKTDNDEEEARKLLFSLQKNIQSLQNEINELSGRLGELKVNSTRHETRLEDLEAEIRYNFGSIKEVREHQSDRNFEQEIMLEKIKNLKHQLDLIGGIDPETEKEYQEIKERFDFLTSQVEDLMAAIKGLEEIIKKLDITIKEKFDEEFKLISHKFLEYFKILFNGGQAKIIKVMENEDQGNKKESSNDEAESQHDEKGCKNMVNLKKINFLKKHNATGLAGIEIQATPPGKKIRSVSMLSGGERALTSIALICAIISSNPSPFVVLDEVDAALDEANSERLAKILDDLSHKTQFIVITHNRASMRRANVLYGVTMGDDGVSKLLSVKLEDVKTE